jgi:hypothetical protein
MSPLAYLASSSAMKEKHFVKLTPDGGVVLIGGSNNGTYFNTLYYLPHAGRDAHWEKLPQKLAIARDYHAATLVPDKVMESCQST